MTAVVVLALLLLLAALGTALAWAVRTARGRVEDECESCRLRPAVRVVLARGELFLCCQPCAESSRPAVRS